MGLHIHSLESLPQNVEKDYFIYLLDYGWQELFSEALDANFKRMAQLAEGNNAVVIRGNNIGHFSNQVFSWHQINGITGEEILPAILITNQHPADFKKSADFEGRSRDLYQENGEMKLMLIPLSKFCKNSNDVTNLIHGIFEDISNKRDFKKFKIYKKIHKGVGQSVLDAVVLEPNVGGVGIDLKKLISDFFR